MGNRTVPFLDAFPLTVWLHMDSPLSGSRNDDIADLHVLASVTNLISVQINKYQASFLTKLLKQFSEVRRVVHLPSFPRVEAWRLMLVYFALADHFPYAGRSQN